MKQKKHVKEPFFTLPTVGDGTLYVTLSLLIGLRVTKQIYKGSFGHAHGTGTLRTTRANNS